MTFRLKLFAVTALALALTGAAAARMLQTQVEGLERVTKDSGVDSTSYKSVTASCPAGKRPIGAGGSVSAATGVALLKIVPNDSWTGVEAVGVEVSGGTPATWHVTAYAICAKSFASYKVVKATSAGDASTTKAVGAKCTAGTKLLGAGADPAMAGDNKPVLTGIFPFPLDGQSIAASASKVAASTKFWVIHAHAICGGNVGSSLGYWYQDGASDSISAKAVTRNCPAGQVLLGAGGKINTTNTTANGKVGLTGIKPSSDLKSVTVGGREVGSGTSTNWSISAWAICHNP